ncbi:MAG: ABC transporter permease, partial [Clostridiales bacterium]|nr:ABC transporter permease [Clostridiales bacterium]
RNAKLFLRDKATFFFSLLSSLILILLYFLFIANIYIDGITANTPFDEKAAGFMVYLQMMIGVLILNSMSLSLGMFSSAANDYVSKKLHSFMTTPIKKTELLISYYIGGLIVSFLINLFTWVITVVIIGAATTYWIKAATFFSVVGVLAVASLISSSIMMLLTAIVKSPTALGVINGVAGTFLGFLCGIYMPYNTLGDGVKAVGSLIPFTHLTVWGKKIVLEDAFNQIGISGPIKEALMNDQFTASGVGFLTLDAPLWVMLLVSGIVGLICLTVAGFLFFTKRFGQNGLHKIKKSDKQP